MGSWHGTCGITGLPILYGEPIRLCFVAPVNRLLSEGSTHPSDLVCPVSVPLKGNYDDYGGADFDPDCPITSITLRYLRIPEKSDQALFGWVMDNKPICYTDGQALRDVGIWMVKENVYRFLIKGGLSEEWNSRQISDTIRVIKSTPPEGVLDLWKSEDETIRAVQRAEITFRRGFSYLSREIIRMVAEGEMKHVSEIVTSIHEFLRMYSKMEDLRATFQIRSGAGDNSLCLDTYRNLANITIAETIRLLQRERESESEEE